MKFQKTITVTAIKADKDVEIVDWCGKTSVLAGEWLVQGDEYCLRSVKDLAAEGFTVLDMPEDEEEESLREGLKTGHL